jgi:spore germination protein
MSKQSISTSQLTLIMASFLTAGSGLSLVKDTILFARQDAWFTFFPAMLYGFLVSICIIYLSRNSVEPTLFELNKKLAGNTFGSLINVWLMIYLVLSVSMDLRELSEFIKTILLYNTPTPVINLCILVLAVYLVRAGIEVLVRVNHVYYLATLIMFLVMPILLLNEVTFSNLKPVFGSGLIGFSKGAFNLLGLYGEVLIIGAVTFAFTPKVEPGKIHPLLRGIMLGTFLATMMMVTLLVSIGTSMGSKAMYPNLFVLQMIHITDFLDRLDILMTSVFIPSLIMKICIVYYALCECTSSIGQTRTESRAFSIVLLPLVFLFTRFSFRNVIDLLHFQSQVWPIFTLLTQIPLLIILVSVKWQRGKRSANA